MAWAQTNVGVSYSIFQNVIPKLPHFESRWLNSMRNFLRLIQGELRLDVPLIPPIQKVNDSYIMDHVFVPYRQWIVPHQQQRQVWMVYFDPASDSIFFPKIGTFEKHNKILGVFLYKYGGWSTTLPSTAYPVSLTEHSRG